MITLLVTIALLVIPVLLFIVENFIQRSKKFPPGPLRIPVIGSAYALGSEPHKKIIELKKKYGNIIGMYFGSYRAIILNDYDMILKVFSLSEVQNRPKLEISFYTRGEDPTGISWSSGKTHGEQREFLIKTLKSFGMGKQTMEFLLQETLVDLYRTLDKNAGKIVVNDDLFNTAAMASLWKIVSGESVNEDDENFKEILRISKKVVTGFNNYVYFYPTMCKMFPNISGWNNFVQNTVQQKIFVSNIIESHKMSLSSADDEPTDVMEAFLQKIKSTSDSTSSFFGNFGELNMVSTIVDVIIAGTETVSTTLVWLLSILIRHPDIQEKMHLAIDKVIGRNRLPSLSDRQQLPYIEAVIFEIFRYSGLAPGAAPHVTSKELEIDGYTIPKNTIVIPDVYGALHDPKYWDSPDEFKPERFLNEDGSAIVRSISSKADLIFGYGKRICPGANLAKDELFLLIAGLGQRYTFRPDPSSHFDPEIKTDNAITLVPKPHTLIIDKRLSF